ncbi:MAG: hypothetical protein JWO83_4696 [Caulobacteraceae bacterium]|nr:hypothetical protein [Caulobacteraceae bacterium]
MCDGVLIAALIDLQSFGLFNQLLGPRLADLIVSVISAGLHAEIESLSTTENVKFDAMLFGDEYYFFAWVRPDSAPRLLDRIERDVMSLQTRLQGRFAPVLIVKTSGRDGPYVPAELRDRLSDLGVLAAPVSRTAELEGMAVLPPGRTITDLSCDVTAEFREDIRIVEHGVSAALHDLGLDRLPLPYLRLGCAVFTLDRTAGNPGDCLDFAMQELNAGLGRARLLNHATFRLEMTCGAPRVLSRGLRQPDGPTPDFLPKLEQRVAREGLGADAWQVLICRTRWGAESAAAGADGVWSLGDLIAHTNPRVSEKVVQSQARWFSTYWTGVLDEPASEGDRHLCGLFGGAMALVLFRRALDQATLRRHLEAFWGLCVQPAGVVLARIEALSCAGEGTEGLLDALSLGPSFQSWGTNQASAGPIDIAPISVNRLRSFQRTEASRRTANLAGLLALRAHRERAG